MLTIPQVIAVKVNEPISGMVGLISYIFPKEEKKNPMTQLPYFRQTLLLQDGTSKVFVMIDDPQDALGFFDDSHKGRKLYISSVLDGKKKMTGIKRGSDLPSTRAPGEMNSYVFVSNKAQLSWSAPTSGSEPPAIEAEAVEPEGSFETAVPAKTAAPAQKAAAPASGQDWNKVLGQVLVQYNDCLEDAVKIAERLSAEIGKTTGSPWSSEDVSRMANAIFAEATRRMR